MTKKMQTITPVDGSVYVERELASWDDISRVLDEAGEAQREWRTVPLTERVALGRKLVKELEDRADEWAMELTMQMGRPIRFSPRELVTAGDRTRVMCDLAEEGLANVPGPEKDGFKLFMRREPLGTVLVVPAWNYPWLIAVNSVVPALVAGNAVVVKHSSQTPLVAERLGEALKNVGLPAGLYRHVHAGHADTERAVADPRVGFVAFTGSVGGGHKMVQAAKDRFVNQGLELGGKDPAYVRPDADLESTLDGLVDGSFFNSGQSCCGIERIYVHQDLYQPFLEGFLERARQYKVGDPREEETDLGPLARPGHAAFVKGQVEKAVKAGAKAHLDPSEFGKLPEGEGYLPPQVLTEVSHAMDVMKEETFGPVAGIMPVSGDDEAVGLMNDSPYGLTASVWTRDEEAAMALGDRVETGTWFMNRCDYLEPGLAWVGVKDTGRGCTLSKIGYEQLTRPKSFHLKL